MTCPTKTLHAHFASYGRATNVAFLDADVAKVFKDSESVKTDLDMRRRGLVSLVSGAIIVALLSGLSWLLNTPWLLFVALYPGMVASLLITGGHGGSRSEDGIAVIVRALLHRSLLGRPVDSTVNQDSNESVNRAL